MHMAWYLQIYRLNTGAAREPTNGTTNLLSHERIPQ